jgi:hypothetical protein
MRSPSNVCVSEKNTNISRSTNPETPSSDETTISNNRHGRKTYVTTVASSEIVFLESTLLFARAMPRDNRMKMFTNAEIDVIAAFAKKSEEDIDIFSDESEEDMVVI